MTEEEKIEFIKTYSESKCLAEALEKLHISEYAVKEERKRDADFEEKFKDIANRHQYRIVDEEVYQERKKRFLAAYASGMNFFQAIKVAGLKTHAFQYQKETDKEFARRYKEIARPIGFHSYQRETQKGTKICVKCGRELPSSRFDIGRKSCNECLRERRELIKINIEEKREIQKIKKKIVAADNECQRLANLLDTNGYLDARRNADILKQKYESLLVKAKGEYATVYHINLTNR